MDTSVVICADELDNIIFPTKNPDYGYIRVEQVVAKFTPGWIKREKRSALLAGSMKDLTSFDLYAGMPISGKIVVRESLEPFSTTNPEKHIKRAGKDGIPCTLKGRPIYRQSFFTNNLEEKDNLIQHDNTDEIIESQILQDEVIEEEVEMFLEKQNEKKEDNKEEDDPQF